MASSSSGQPTLPNGLELSRSAEVDNEVWTVYLGPFCLGRFREGEWKLHGTYVYNTTA